MQRSLFQVGVLLRAREVIIEEVRAVISAVIVLLSGKITTPERQLASVKR